MYLWLCMHLLCIYSYTMCIYLSICLSIYLSLSLCMYIYIISLSLSLSLSLYIYIYIYIQQIELRAAARWRLRRGCVDQGRVDFVPAAQAEMFLYLVWVYAEWRGNEPRALVFPFLQSSRLCRQCWGSLLVRSGQGSPEERRGPHSNETFERPQPSVFTTVFVRFRAAVTEHLTVRPCGQQLLMFFCSRDRESLEHTSSSYVG